ncbi:MAG: glutamine-hydrolyzing GMP synthase, partial [Candidatus Desulforudis sp.]|nr:glutamine-hydrolyzing GMP synthase [Desulforudis sp.]
MQAPVGEFVLVLDFGGQYTQLIARRIRECRVYCEILPYHTPVAEIVARRPKGIVFSGGPSSVYQEGAPQCAEALYAAGIPILGICYGMQLMARQLGGTVARADRREYGKTELEVLQRDVLFQDLDEREQCWMSHGDRVDGPPPGFQVTARTNDSPCAAIVHPVKKLYGLQFHPEVRHTPKGTGILKRFLYDVCGCRGDWTMASFLDDAVAQIKREAGGGRVLCALSGGVDSSVAAALVHRAV